MFKLIYRDGAPENAGHYMSCEKEKGTGKSLSVGELVNLTNGVAKRYEDGSGKPFGVVAINAKEDDDEVVVLVITEDMIFRVGYDGYSVMKSLEIGKVIGISYSYTSPYNTACFQITNIVHAVTSVDPTDEDGEYVSSATIEGRFVDVRSTVG